MKKIGIIGQNGFIGKHLFNTLGLYPDKYSRVPFERAWFEDETRMDAFVSQCDVIVHLAGMNRHHEPEVIYDTNINLVKTLIASLERTQSDVHVIFSSSSQEERDNLYGRSKKEGRLLLARWAAGSNGHLTAMIIPNVFGPFGHPYYNSVVATFCHQLTHDETPRIDVDGQLKLIYVGELVEEILSAIESGSSYYNRVNTLEIAHTPEIRVSDILNLLTQYKEQYVEKGVIPAMQNTFERNLFNTFRCYMPIREHFPVKFLQHKDSRGAFVEVIRLGMGGQVSFSTTVPSITRGNHFHTRKIERFAVIKGKALIQLRQVGTDEVLNFYLDGEEPAYVDMPIWYTHNIKNIGEEELYTIFWINECYYPDDPDTWFENV